MPAAWAADGRGVVGSCAVYRRMRSLESCGAHRGQPEPTGLPALRPDTRKPAALHTLRRSDACVLLDEAAAAKAHVDLAWGGRPGGGPGIV